MRASGLFALAVSAAAAGVLAAALGAASISAMASESGAAPAGAPACTAAERSCGSVIGPAPGDAGARGLPDSYALPPGTTLAEAEVVAFAIDQLDRPYLFGAAGPAAFDCSGLTMAAWAQAGVRLPHSTLGQAEAGTATTRAALVAGDLVLVAGDDGSIAAPEHVGLYLGDDLVLNASDERDGIRVQTFADFVRVGGGLSALRHIR